MCITILVHACILIIVYVSCPARLLFGAIQVWGSGGRRLLGTYGGFGGPPGPPMCMCMCMCRCMCMCMCLWVGVCVYVCVYVYVCMCMCMCMCRSMCMCMCMRMCVLMCECRCLFFLHGLTCICTYAIRFLTNLISAAV